MSKPVEKANLIIVVITILILIAIAGVSGYKYYEENYKWFVEAKHPQ